MLQLFTSDRLDARLAWKKAGDEHGYNSLHQTVSAP
jgi:hypothetical protein